MTKNAKILIIMLLVLTAFISVALFDAPKESAYAINLYDQIEVNKTADGYSYGNGESYRTANTLQKVFDDVLNEDVTVNAIFNFGDFTTADTIVINATRKVVISGTVRFDGATNQTFITVQGGVLQLTGAIINSNRGKLIEVKSGAEFIMESGNIGISGEVSGLIQSTVVNRGTTTLKGGVISYASTDSKNTGYAMSQFDSTASLVVEEDSLVQLYGSSALLIGGGVATINDGTFNGNSDSVSENGSALKLRNDAKVTINGGSFSGKAKDRVVVISGTKESYVDFRDGAIEGQILFGKTSSANGARLKINDKAVLPTHEGLVEIYASEGDVLTPDNAQLGVRADEGYYVKEWSGIAKANPLISEFNNGTAISPTLSNEYEIRFVVDGVNHDFNFYYGSYVNPSELSLTIPIGYELCGWVDEDDNPVDLPIKVINNVVFTATLGVGAAEIEQIEPVNKVYDGDVASRTANVQEIDDFSYVYLWERQGLGKIWSSYAETKTASFLSVADSGTYRLKVVVTDGVTSKESFSNEFSVQINKADYVGITHPSLSGVYDKQKTLADYPLEEGFAWLRSDITPTVPIKEYDATYIKDAVNYNPIVVKVTIDLQKAAGVVKTHNAIANKYVYDSEKTLADYPFADGSGWRWSDTTITPTAGTKAYSAYYNPDEENYEDYVTTVALAIGKATFNQVEDVTLYTTYVNGLTLKDVLQLNQSSITGYRLASSADQSTLLNQCKTFEFSAIYNVDTQNYNDYNSAKIYVTVTKGSNIVDYNATNTINAGAYDPTRTLADIELISSEWSWQSPQTVPTVTDTKYNLIYNPNPNLYYDYVLEITVIVEKATLQSVTHAPLSGTYSSNKTLADYSLESGWSWQYQTIVPTVNVTKYQAVYDAGVNYNLYYCEVTLTLRKAQIDVSGITLKDLTIIYDGQVHSITYDGTLPDGVSVAYYNNDKVNAGNYVVEMAFSQVDLVNYLPIAPMSALLTIKKAPPVISVNAVYKYAYDGKVHMPTATINNGEQILHYEVETEVKEVGEYSVRYYVAESINYLFAQKVVKVVINPLSKNVGSVYGDNINSFIGKISESTYGISADSNVSMDVVSLTNQEAIFSVLIDGEAQEGDFTINVLIPDEMLGTSLKLYKLIGDGYQEIALTANGNYVIFNTETLGVFRLATDGKWTIVDEPTIEWWGWLLISLSIVVVLVSVFTILIAYKKGKLPIDKVKKLIVDLRGKSRRNND
ncbi:MAG: hypothetical protein J6R35_01500 [Clostridia bacterium]|nr:hypothetical protein [Clostridia bacterium]